MFFGETNDFRSDVLSVCRFVEIGKEVLIKKFGERVGLVRVEDGGEA